MDAVPDIVDIVLWVLAILSVMTWTIIFVKGYSFWRHERCNRIFLSTFTKAGHIRDVHCAENAASGILASVCVAGLQEIQTLKSPRCALPDIKDQREMLYHALRQKIHLEQSRLESGLVVLASVGSTSPFIGLFGTVWGIMHALKSIADSGSAGLDVVAGPIGEALVATAMGIVAAIPAVLAYNYFLRRVRLSVTTMEHFAEHFLHLVIKSGMGEK